MLRIFKSIRSKLTLWYSFVLLTTLVAFAVIAYTYASEKLSKNLDLSLQNEVMWVNDFIKLKASKVKPSKKYAKSKEPVVKFEVPAPAQEGAESDDPDAEVWNQIYQHVLLNPKKTMIEVTDSGGNVVFRSYSVGEENLKIEDVPLNEIRMSTLRAGTGEELRVAATTNKNAKIYVAYPLAELRELLENLFAIFLVFIPVALTISVGGGWFLAYKSLRPVDVVTWTARKITAENLDQQIPHRGVNDEIGRLVSTFNNMIMRLRDSFDRIRQFSIDASHEMRTPLTVMRGEVELALRNPKTPEEYRRVLASNLEEILRLSAIIDNLLTLSRADKGQHVLSLEPTNLKELIEELFEDCEILASNKQIAVKVLKNEDITISGDKNRLRQLFLNLIDNAVKYTPAKGKISLAVERQNGFARVQVRDTGIGIPKDEQEKIFDRFYRVDKARSREFGGTGLGLSIVKLIVELHKGRIEVRSDPKRGSTFSVYLPI
ncbi:MAG TPA: ATP-binding protein [Bacteroidota bacterium]|nr:ATP-binding protein [Bacteroidota bacterium]